jgi:hypothetical protein
MDPSRAPPGFVPHPAEEIAAEKKARSVLAPRPYRRYGTPEFIAAQEAKKEGYTPGEVHKRPELCGKVPEELQGLEGPMLITALKKYLRDGGFSEDRINNLVAS